MPTLRRPRFGSLQYWPRKRAKKSYARVRSWPDKKEAKPMAFIGYKVGMTHIMAINENKDAHTKGEELAVPVTIIECPPIKICSIRFYNSNNNASQLKKEIFFKSEKNLNKKTILPKENSKDLESINPDEYDNITITIYSQPSKAGFGKKKPDVVEIAIGGKNADKVEYVKQNFDKELEISTIFSENDLVDIRAVTKGKGFQGPVKRFGIGLKNHKAEKGTRQPGSLGPWVRQQHIMWKVAHAGQTGYHQRTEHNKQILKISDDVSALENNFHKYGNVKSQYIIMHGSIAGPKKRAVILTTPLRNNVKKHQLSIQ